MPETSDLRQSDAIIGALDESAPVIDARRLLSQDNDERTAVVEEIRAACREPGFFYVENAFADSPVLHDALARMREFFELPDDDPVKQSVCNASKAGTYGWMPMFAEPAYQPGTIAHVESFDCGRDLPGTEKALEGENVWPPIDGFRRDVVAYWDAITELGNLVLECISEAAGLDRNYLPELCDSQQLNTLRLLHYPANEVAGSKRDVGIAAHTDFECITLIMQTQPGLELTDVNGHWYDAPGHDGRIVVLLDDMLERLTNGKFRATGHRVRNTRHQRYSIVMFFAVNDGVIIEPLPQFVSDGDPSRYPAVTQREHIDREVDRAEKYRDAMPSQR
jgi:isopenicillin N synthase-like dioxygenase